MITQVIQENTGYLYSVDKKLMVFIYYKLITDRFYLSKR